MKLTAVLLGITFSLISIAGCNNSEITRLKQENNDLKNRIHFLEQKNAKLENEIDKLKNPPDRLYLNALSYERNRRIKEAKSEYQKLIKWYPESREANNAKFKLLEIEKEEKSLNILSNFESALKSKFAGSSEAILLSLEIRNGNLVVSAKHPECDYYDSIFIDIGVAGYRSSDIKNLKFSKVILELHCSTHFIKKYYVSRSQFLQYINLSINDPKFISFIKLL